MIGQAIGSYVLESKLGEGGMGEVYLGRHKSLGTLAAVKVMAPAFSHDPRLHERFSREARTQAQLRHPNIAQVLDHVEQDGRWFLVVEYMENGTLEDVLADRREPLGVAEALAWVRQALRGLDFAHSKGIIHRDVKPANILINDRGEAAMTDFGIALEVGARRLTQTGMSIGTPEYMSPEQIRGAADVDHRTDLYSMGTVLYELLAGRVPFEASSTFEVQRAQVSEPPPPLRELRPEIPAELEALVMRALAKEPADRYASCGELADLLEAYERGEAPPVAPRTPPPAGRSKGQTVFEGATGAGIAAPPPPSPLPPSSPSPSSVQRQATVLASSREHLAPPPPPKKRRSWAAGLGIAAVLVAVLGALGWWLLQEEEPGEPSRLAAIVEKVKGFAEQARLAANAAAEAAAEAKEAALRAGEGAREAQRSARGRACSLALNSATGAGDHAVRAGERSAVAAIEAEKAAAAAKAAAEAEEEAKAEGEEMAAAGALRRALEALAGIAYADEAEGEDADPARTLEEAAEAVREAQEAAAEARSSAEAASAAAADAERAAEEARREAEGCATSGPPPPPPPPLPPRTQPPVTPPPPPLDPRSLPEKPVVAVLATGERAMAGAFEGVLEQRLLRGGLDVRDEHNSLELQALLDRKGDDVAPSDVLPILAAEGFHVVVLVKAEVGDQREIHVAGQYLTLTSGRLRLNAHLLPARRALGRGWTERVEYTELNADAKAGQALLGATSDLVTAIRDGWESLRRGGR